MNYDGHSYLFVAMGTGKKHVERAHLIIPAANIFSNYSLTTFSCMGGSRWIFDDIDVLSQSVNPCTAGTLAVRKSYKDHSLTFKLLKDSAIFFYLFSGMQSPLYNRLVVFLTQNIMRRMNNVSSSNNSGTSASPALAFISVYMITLSPSEVSDTSSFSSSGIELVFEQLWPPSSSRCFQLTFISDDPHHKGELELKLCLLPSWVVLELAAPFNPLVVGHPAETQESPRAPVKVKKLLAAPGLEFIVRWQLLWLEPR